MDTSSNTGLNLPDPIGQQNTDVVPAGASTLAHQVGGLGNTQPTGATLVQAVPQQANAASELSDELDKEWINKAKHIVEQTKQDPFAQSHEIGKIKANYLNTRFNKHIKLIPDQAL